MFSRQPPRHRRGVGSATSASGPRTSCWSRTWCTSRRSGSSTTRWSRAAAELSPREREALSRLSLGAEPGGVADALQISENTLRAYIDCARHKLGAMNVTHAVALALARGHHRADGGVA